VVVPSVTLRRRLSLSQVKVMPLWKVRLRVEVVPLAEPRLGGI
jgi:hypothetical protein